MLLVYQQVKLLSCLLLSSYRKFQGEKSGKSGGGVVPLFLAVSEPGELGLPSFCSILIVRRRRVFICKTRRDSARVVQIGAFLAYSRSKRVKKVTELGVFLPLSWQKEPRSHGKSRDQASKSSSTGSMSGISHCFSARCAGKVLYASAAALSVNFIIPAKV